MPINEIFKHPTVKTVIFQIKFPNLFYIEKVIGDYQVKILDRFPDSALVLKKGFQISFGFGVQPQAEDEDDSSTKIWQFSYQDSVKLNVQTNSLDISSTSHKTYKLGDKDRFRDTIQFAVDHFLSTVPIPIITRIGLRYIDHCPITKKDNETYLKFYNTCFPLTRFSMESADELDFRARVTRGDYHLTYRETAQTKDNEFKLILDFDAFALKVKPEDYLSVTDKLHDLITDEFDVTAKEPLRQYMRN